MNATPGHWSDRAACVEVGVDPFYPEPGEAMDRAKAVCRTCEVRVECLAFALSVGDWEGIWGGFTERVRRRIAREHNAGRSLEDIIAADDARHYARIETLEAGGDECERRQARERRRRGEKRQLLTGTESVPRREGRAA